MRRSLGHENGCLVQSSAALVEDLHSVPSIHWATQSLNFN